MIGAAHMITMKVRQPDFFNPASTTLDHPIEQLLLFLIR
jgi:hypothetical protein